MSVAISQDEARANLREALVVVLACIQVAEAAGLDVGRELVDGLEAEGWECPPVIRLMLG